MNKYRKKIREIKIEIDNNINKERKKKENKEKKRKINK